MKKLVILLFAAFAFAGVATAQEAGPDFKFEKEVHDFDKVTEGDKAKFDFKFTNVGTEPLVITGVQASCGCTTPQWPKEPIKPGESSVISAVYNSKGRPGSFNKAITITSNAKTARKVLYIKGTVVKEAPAPSLESPQLGPTEGNGK